MSLNVLVTGGAGYIGSHVVVEVSAAGHVPIVLDNFENSSPDVIGRLARLCGDAPETLTCDLRDGEAVRAVFGRRRFDAVIHLAGKKAVAESVAAPLLYYDANVGAALNLLRAMQDQGDVPIIFSSSATVYGHVDSERIGESARMSPTNPYGATKAMIEQIIADLVAARALPSAVSLRYFNPVGAHSSGLIGESPRQTPQNLFPIIAQTAAGLRGPVKIFGDDYPTLDGTGVRDYVHVVDLARGHVAALRAALRETGRCLTMNLGTGRGYSVREALDAFSRACGMPVPHQMAPRRMGDVACCVADPSLACALLGWRASHSLEEMCRDHWRFQQRMLENLTT